jgi:hypothetical protein
MEKTVEGSSFAVKRRRCWRMTEKKGEQQIPFGDDRQEMQRQKQIPFGDDN